MALRPAALALFAMASLAACGTAANDPFLNTARGLVTGLLNRADDAPAIDIDLRQVLSREVINDSATPLILVESEGLSGAATMIRIGTNGPNETWEGTDEVTLTLSQEGVLRATRGLAFDLAAADVEGTRRALRTRHSGPIQRAYSHVAGDLEMQTTGYSCVLDFASPTSVTIFGDTRSLTPVTETCSRHPTGETLTNRYWIDGSGFAWVSEQWAGEELGHFRIERLYR